MLTHRFDGALVLAAQLHRKQRRKGTDVPYLSHLLAVSALVIEYGGDEDQAIAALLHDAVEDQGGQATHRLIENEFGPRVAAIVAACSDSNGDEKPPSAIRKRAYIATLPEKSGDAILVSACDKLHNATAILEDLRAGNPAVFDRFSVSRDETLKYYRDLADIISTRVRPDLGTRLSRVVDALVAEA